MHYFCCSIPTVGPEFLPYTKGDQPGLALVIINKNFKHPDSNGQKVRVGADLDKRLLRTTFENYGYRVQVEEDKTSEEIREIFESVTQGSNGIRPSDKGFVCCISSHGAWDPKSNKDVIYGVNGRSVEEEGKIICVEDALDIKRCALKYFEIFPALKGKPKLFFVQACRGSAHVKLASADPGLVKSTNANKNNTYAQIPIKADFLIAYGTTEGDKAYRRDGSIFIRCLCDNLETYAERFPLTIILKHVSYDMGTKEEYLLECAIKDITGNITDTVKVRGCANYYSSLRGPVFFTADAEYRYRHYVTM